MADNKLITLPVTTEDGRKISVAIRVPSDKLTMKDGKIVGGDDEFIGNAIQQKLDLSYPKTPRVNAPERLKYSTSRGGMQGDPRAEDDFAKEHPVLSGIASTLGAPFRNIINRAQTSPEYTEKDTAPEDIGWKRAATGLGDTAATAFDLLSMPGLIKGIRKPKDLLTIGRGVLGYEAGSRGIEAGTEATGVDPSIARLAGMAAGVGGAGIATGGSPRINDALIRGTQEAEVTPLSKLSGALGSLGGAVIAKHFNLPSYAGMAAGAALGAETPKIPAFVKGMLSAKGPWIDPAITGMQEPASPAPTPFFPGTYPGPQLASAQSEAMPLTGAPATIRIPGPQPTTTSTSSLPSSWQYGRMGTGMVSQPLGLPEPTPAENVFYGGPEGLEPSTRGVPSPIIPAEPVPNVTPYRVPVVPPSRRLEAAKPAERVFEMPEKTPEPGTEKIPEKPTEPEPKRTPVRPPVKRTQTGATPRDVTVKDVDPEALHDFIKRQASGVELGKIQEKFGLTEEQAKQHLESLKTANKIHQKGSKWHAGEKTTVNPPKGKKETTAEDAEWEALNKKDTEGELTDAEEARWMELSEKRAKKSSSETETETETSKKPVVYSNKVAGFKKTFEAMKKQDPSKWSEFQTARFQELQDILYKAGKERTPSEIESRITEIEEAKKTKDASNEQSEINKDEPKPKPENAKGSTPISGKIIAESDPSWQPGKEISRAQIVTIAKSLGVSSGQVARSLQAAGHKVQESIQPRGWGIKPKGKKAPE